MLGDSNKGFFWGAFAFSFWGFVPLYWIHIKNVEAIELTVHRVFWGTLCLSIYMIFKKEFRKSIFQVIRDRKQRFVILTSTLLIGCNWGIFIYSVQVKQLLAASLGYFINPLFNIFLGRIIFKEELSLMKIIAITLATLGILLFSLQGIDNIFITAGLFITFGLYGSIRKSSQVKALPGLFWEMAFLVIPGILFVLYTHGRSQWPLHLPIKEFWIIPLSGPITLVPLLAFNIAVKELRYSTVGILQYLAPTFQFIVGYFAFKEPISEGKLLSFAFVWLALIFYTYELLSERRKHKALDGLK